MPHSFAERRVVLRLVLLLAALAAAACTEPVATIQNGRTRVPLDSAFTVNVLPDRATTFEFPAAPGTGIYLDVSATGGPARVTAGDATRGLLQATIGVDPVRGAVRTATIRAGTTGGVQVTVMPPLPGVGVAGAAAQVTLRARADTSFDPAFNGGRVLAGVRYGTAAPGCSGFGYIDVQAPVTATIMGRSNRNPRFAASLVYQGPAGTAFLGASTPWQPVVGVDSLDLAQGAAAHDLLTSGRWAMTACDTIGEARFQIAFTRSSPETLLTNQAFGDTVVGESIDAPGDVDTFTIPIPAGIDTFFVAISGGDRAGTRLLLDVNQFCCFLNVVSRGGGTPLLSNTTPIILGAGIGRTQVTLTVRGQAPIGALNRGPYRFAVLRAPSEAPEIAGSVRAIGDTVRGETLWTAVDSDRFTLAVPPGTDFTVQLRKIDDVGLPTRLAVTRVNQGGAFFSGVVADTVVGGVVRLPIGSVAGTIYLRVDSPDRSFMGRYELVLLPGLVP